MHAYILVFHSYMRRRITFIVLLEAYALLLSVLQYAHGLRTDEAKYLLSIPYPHPPLLRDIIAFTNAVPGHEFLWRFLFASLLVQCVWLFIDLGVVLTQPRRRALILGWLFATAVMIQGGTVMLVLPTACFFTFFVWFALHTVPPSRSRVSFLACVWFASLFTAYQSLLFLPIVWTSMRRTSLPLSRVILYTGVPVLLLVLYTLTNPFALVSMLSASVQDSPIPLGTRLGNVGLLLLIGGSAALTLTGIVGLVTSRRTDLVLTFALVLGYAMLTTQFYYAILFTPLLVGGTFLLLCKRKLRPSFLSLAHVLTALFAVFMLRPNGDGPLRARETMRLLKAQGIEGSVIIDGNFGHDWQYEAGDLSIVRFTPVLSADIESAASAFICTKQACDEDIDTSMWVRLPEAPVPVWIKRSR